MKHAPETKKLISSLRAEIASLQVALEQAKRRKEGIRSDGTVDKYSQIDGPGAAIQLRALITKRGGNPDTIIAGYHSRQKNVKMREWLRANPAKLRNAKK